MLQPIPMDTGSFETIRASVPQMLYVDKTAWFHRLITNPQARNFFMARPRRFGKSLMISTLKAIFEGRRELFKGLAIDSMDYDWTAYPVIYMNFGFAAGKTWEEFESGFKRVVKEALAAVGCAYDETMPAALNFAMGIDDIYASGKKVVILIDEYDDPVSKVLDDVPLAERVRDRICFLYGQLKDRSEKIRFMMITGVSKFTKMSVFSALSNLVDLTFDDDYSSMLGYTEDELDRYFGDYMAAHAEKMGLSLADYRAELRRLYNGYRFWTDEGENVYNPVSINLTLGNRSRRFKFYWSDTGRAASLMNVLKRGNVQAVEPECVTNVGYRAFDVSDLANLHAVPMLYQTGYLTIKDYNEWTNTYTLGVPDEEVRQDLALLMVAMAASKDVSWATALGTQLLSGQWEKFFAGLKALYASAPYGSTEGRVHESSYTRNLLFLLKGQGIICQPEVVQADGRVDLVATHHCGIYIFEMKVDKPATIAMTQMERKNYAAPYAADGRPVWLIGLAFDSTTHGLKNCCVEPFRI